MPVSSRIEGWMDKPPYAFWLVAAVLAVQCLIALATVGACLWWSSAIVDGRFSCAPAADRVMDLMVGALAAALAFSGNRTGK